MPHRLSPDDPFATQQLYPPFVTNIAKKYVIKMIKNSFIVLILLKAFI